MAWEKLAIEGGSPIRKEAFPSWPRYDPDQIEAAAEVLRSGRVNFWTGEEGAAFEREFAELSAARYGVAVANGTVALELALRALGIGAGDEVVVPGRTFVATATSVIQCGARPVFADVDRDSQVLTPASVKAVLTSRTRAVLPVHYGGWPCDMEGIAEIARDRDLKVVEDCAQAHGASLRGRPVGSFGDAAAFSFCQDKILSTGGEGGMLVTSDEAVRSAAWSYKEHGKDPEAPRAREEGGDGYWIHRKLGTNWRMTEMQAAIGRIQLGRLTEWVEQRRENAFYLLGRLKEFPGLRAPLPKPEAGHSFYHGFAFLEPHSLNPDWDRGRILAALRAEGIPCRRGAGGEVYREAVIRDRGLDPPSPLPNSRELEETCLMFRVDPALGREEMDATVAAVRKVVGHAVSG